MCISNGLSSPTWKILRIFLRQVPVCNFPYQTTPLLIHQTLPTILKKQMIKKITLLISLFSLLSLSSCNEKEVADLTAKVSELKKENANLRDSISSLKINELYDYQILGTTEQSALKVNEKSKINFSFAPRKDILNYNVYEVTDPKKGEKKLILKDQSFSEFEYYFTPNKIGESRIDLLTVFNLDSMSIEIPAVLFVKVIE